MNPPRVKPASCIKANAADLANFAAPQETLALLQILALGNRQVEEGKVVPAAEAFGDLRSRTRPR